MAAGRLSAVISREVRLRDDAVGALIVREAGAHYSDTEGQDVFPLKPDLPALLGQLIQSEAAPIPLHMELIRMVCETTNEQELTE